MSESAERPEQEETTSAERKMLIVDIFYGASQDPVTEGFGPQEWTPNDNINDVVRRALNKEEKRDKANRVLTSLNKGNPMIYEGTNPKYRSKPMQARDPIGKYLVEKDHEGTKYQHLEIRVPEPQEGGIISIETLLEMLPPLEKDEKLLWEHHEKIIKKYQPENASGSTAESMYGL